MTRQLVFDATTQIPKGKVATYGHIAKIVGLKSPRAAGSILHSNTNPFHIPCHRVVFADGYVSSSYAFGGALVQKYRLQQEGVTFDTQGRVDFSKHLHTF